VRKIFCCLFISMILFRPLISQQARQFSFRHFSSFNGLSSNLVNQIIQDHDGYIWLATLDGLQRYDGNKFITLRHRPGDPTTIPSDIISQLLIDKNGRLWILMNDNQVGIVDRTNFTFTPVSIEGSDIKNPARIFFLDQDSQGNATAYVFEKGLYKYDEQKKIFRFLNPLQGLKGYIGVRHLAGTPYLIFSNVNGVMLFDYRTGNLNYDQHNPDHNPIVEKVGSERSVMDVYGIKGDLFWYTTWDLHESGAPHIKYINLKTGDRNKYSVADLYTHGYTEITGWLMQKNGRVWFHGMPFILEWTGDKEKPFNYIRSEYKDEQSIKFDKVRQMYEDNQHNIWVATENGVFMFNPDAQIFSNYNLIRPDGSGNIDGPTQSALQLKDGRVFVGAWASGLYFYDSNFNGIPLPESLKKFAAPYSIWSIAQSNQNGLVWFGFQGGSVVIFDPITSRSEILLPKEIGGSTVRQIIEDRNGNMWFGLQNGGIVKWDKKLSGGDYQKGFVIVRERQGGFINKLFVDRNGFIWAATEGAGVYKYHPERNTEQLHLTATGNGNRLWSQLNNDILQYNDSLLFIAGGVINVVNTKTNSVRYITTEEGLPSNTIYCLQRDKKGLLWLGMAHGLAQFNVDKRIATVYDRRDGLRFDNFLQAGAISMNDGRLLFLTEHSFIGLDPAKVFQSPNLGQALITDFKLNNRSLDVDSLRKLKTISLSYDNTSISIEFSTLNFVQQNKTHYFYKLDGVDKDWQTADESNHVVYSYLPPGSFTFHVKTENADGVTNDEFAPLQIRVNPPFWKTWWFLGLIILVAVVLMYWLDKQRMQKFRATETVRTRIATSLTEDLSNSLSNINISSELAKTKIDADPQRTKEYIGQISDASNRMIQSVYDMVWSINPNNDTMNHTIERMKAYAVEVESLHHLDIFFDISEEVSKLDLDMEYRYELLCIFKEAIDNIYRHSEARHVHVNLKYQKSKMVMLIEDDGKGFDTDEAAVKRGISDMRRRAAAINASFYIESEINTGTILKLIMPV
jgi:signal transduction histidine kinase